MQDTYRALPNTGINTIACYGNLNNNMFNSLRQMLAKQKPSLSKEAQAFVTKLSATDIWVLAIGVRGTPALPNIADPEEYFKEASKVVVAHRKPLSELGDDDSLFAFNYKWESRRILPFFSSEEHARYFLGDSGFKSDLSLFQPYCLRSGFVAMPQYNKYELLLDARSTSERKIEDDERLLLRSLTASLS